ncbi:MAG: hypothetical protein V1798_08315 [Pseudomonadota bacterium]
MPTPKPDFLRILKILAKHKVDFIVVGGVSAVLQGAPLATFDLDAVHARTPSNIAKLLKALAELDAFFRGQGSRRIKPDASHLASAGHQLLITRYGPLDLLGTIGKDRDYDHLVGHTIKLTVGRHTMVRALRLETLIQTKREVGRAKDKAVLNLLERTLREKSRA